MLECFARCVDFIPLFLSSHAQVSFSFMAKKFQGARKLAEGLLKNNKEVGNLGKHVSFITAVGIFPLKHVTR